MAYNALDTEKLAKQFRDQLVLEKHDINSSLSYEYATSWCDNCPRQEREPQSYDEMEFGIRVASHCCKEDEQWAEDHQGEEERIRKIDAMIASLTIFIGKEADEKAAKS